MNFIIKLFKNGCVFSKYVENPNKDVACDYINLMDSLMIDTYYVNIDDEYHIYMNCNKYPELWNIFTKLTNNNWYCYPVNGDYNDLINLEKFIYKF